MLKPRWRVHNRFVYSSRVIFAVRLDVLNDTGEMLCLFVDFQAGEVDSSCEEVN